MKADIVNVLKQDGVLYSLGTVQHKKPRVIGVTSKTGRMGKGGKNRLVRHFILHWLAPLC